MQLDPKDLALWSAWLVAFSLLIATWRLFLSRRYLHAALVRMQHSGFEKRRLQVRKHCEALNSMQRNLLQHFLTAPTPTLYNLVESTEAEWRARRSKLQSEDPRAARTWSDDNLRTTELQTSDFIQR